MDLNWAIAAAQTVDVRDDSTMKPGWRMHYVAKAGKLFYVDPDGVQRHAPQFTDKMRASPRWRAWTDQDEKETQ